MSETGTVRVVGVAVVRADPRRPGVRQVLAARRRGHASGGWELPGGKCEPGETLEEAAVREVLEELGCQVRTTGRLPGAQPIREACTLEVVTAVLVAGDPRPLEHAELRWLGADELGSVAWLPADLPFLEPLARTIE